MNTRQSLKEERVEWSYDIDEFQDYCHVNLQLSKSTYTKYANDIRRFLSFVKEGGSCKGTRIVRDYLKQVPNNGNALRALKAYFKYINRNDVVEDFKFPRWPIKIRHVTRTKLEKFYASLSDVREQALFLFYSSTGLRKNEVLMLRKDDVDPKLRMVIPKNHRFSKTKHAWITFYNKEAEDALNKYLATRHDKSSKLFPISNESFCKMWRNAREKTGLHLTSQDLRFWFSNEMGRLGVPDRYVDAFCGRISQKIIARHYTDYSPEKLKEIYDKTGLKVLT